MCEGAQQAVFHPQEKSTDAALRNRAVRDHLRKAIRTNHGEWRGILQIAILSMGRRDIEARRMKDARVDVNANRGI